MNRHRKRTQLSIRMRNKTAELARLARLLTTEGVSLTGLSLASVGEHAAVRLTVPADDGLPARLNRAGLKLED